MDHVANSGIAEEASFTRKITVDPSSVINECIEEVVKAIPIHRWERMRECMAWTEYIDGEECYFDLVVLENTSEYVHISVNISYVRAMPDGTLLSPNTGNRTAGVILRK